jgi:hypothetical protein
LIEGDLPRKTVGICFASLLDHFLQFVLASIMKRTLPERKQQLAFTSPTAEGERFLDPHESKSSVRSPHPARYSKSRPLATVMLIAASTILALAFAEGTIRLFSGVLPVELQQVIETDPKDRGVAHPYVGHLQKPNATIIRAGRDFMTSHSTDAYGFRNVWP